MSNEEEIKKMINLIQTSLLDQVSALKADVQRARSDSDAALELSATLEKTISPLDFKKLKILAEMSHWYWQLSMAILTKVVLYEGDKQKRKDYLNLLIDLAKFSIKSNSNVNKATTNVEVESTRVEFIDKITHVMQEQL